MGFYRLNDPTNSFKALKEDRFNPIRSTIQYKTKTHKIHTDKCK